MTNAMTNLLRDWQNVQQTSPAVKRRTYPPQAADLKPHKLKPKPTFREISRNVPGTSHTSTLPGVRWMPQPVENPYNTDTRIGQENESWRLHRLAIKRGEV